MSVTQDQIKKIAKNLSKLPENEGKIIHDIESILGYVEMLSEVDTTGVEPTISVVNQSQPLRQDILLQKDATPEELLGCSRQKIIANQIAVGSIIE